MLLSIVKGGENIKRILLALLILIFAIANVSAEDTAGNLTVVSDNQLIDKVLSADDNIYHITNETINDFISDGEITEDDKIYEFEGDFDDLGILSIVGNNITVRGKDAYFTNTAFNIGGEDNTLSNITMEVYTSFKDNDYSAIYVEGDNTLIDNVNLYYFVPANAEAYGIQVWGTNKHRNENFQLKNSMIYFEGHNYYNEVNNYGILLFRADNALLYNNTIQGSLPLRNVSWDSSPSLPGIYRDIVLTMGAYESDFLNVTGNNIITVVNEIGYASYPTLDAFYIEKCYNCIIKNNSMYTEDFVTPKDIENYLYGIDVYGHLTNLTITGNSLVVNTTGGTYAHGTAYPIQLTGPLSEVYITDNYIESISNGPNIGIYSQNVAGETSLVIDGNFISVTGFAGAHEWALVSGIEVQDTNDRITNNIIEVHSIGDVIENSNLYGVSYRQITPGEHTFNVVNNTVFSEGYYAVAALDAQNSNFEGNMLYTDNEEAIGKNSLKIFDDKASSYNSNANEVRSIWDYLADEYNTQDGGEEFEYETPTNVNNRDNQADGSGITGRDDSPSFDSNPLLPSKDDSSTPSTPSILVPDVADGDPVINPVVPSNVVDSPDGDPGYVKPTTNYENWDGNNKKYTPSQNDGSSSSSSSSDGKIERQYEDWDGNNKEYTPSKSSNSSSSSSDEEIERQYEDWNGNGMVANATRTNSDGESDSDSDYVLQDLLRSYVTSNTEGGSAPSNSYNGNVRYNNTQDYSPSLGENSALGQSQSSADSNAAAAAATSSAGQSGGSSSDGGSKVYEVLKDILENKSGPIIPSVAIVLAILFLLVVGYRRKQSEL